MNDDVCSVIHIYPLSRVTEQCPQKNQQIIRKFTICLDTEYYKHRQSKQYDSSDIVFCIVQESKRIVKQ